MKKFTKIACITAGIMFAIGAILAISGILAGAKSGIFIDWTSHGIRIVPQKDTYTYEAYDITDINAIDINVSNAAIKLIAGITWRICGRNAISFARSFELIFERSVPSSTIEPSVKSAVLLRLDISVVFPQPLGPMIVVIRPDGTSSEMFFNIVSL